MRTLALLCVASATGAQARPAVPPARMSTCVVASVHDGDTIRCRDGQRVRLLAIDAPELEQRPFGRAARDTLRALVPVSKHVHLELDVQKQDRYGRTLAYVWSADRKTLINEAMAMKGMVVALVYPPNVRHVERIRSAVSAARSARRGLWSTDAFSCSPADHRRGRC